MPNRAELPQTIPLPPGGWTDEGERSEYLDGQWIRKPDAGRTGNAMVISELLFALKSAENGGGELFLDLHMLVVPDLLRPDLLLTFPRYTTYQDYLVAPAFLVVEVRCLQQPVSGLVEKCQRKYHPFGVPYCWIFDAEREEGYECHRAAPDPVRKEVLTAGPQIQLSLPEFFQEALSGLRQTGE